MKLNTRHWGEDNGGQQGLYADNVVANPGVGGSTLATDDIGGIQYPRSKIVIGADGSNDGDVSAANPLPVTGTVAVTGVATAANQTTIIGHVDGIETLVTASNALLTTIDADTSDLQAATKLEDAAHTTGDRGIHVLAVRMDSDVSPVSTDGDYHSLIMNSTGRLKVSVKPGATAATTGNITASGQSVTIDVSREAGVNIQVAGTFNGFNGTFEGSIDSGTTYFGVQAVRSSTSVIETTTGVISANPGYAWEISANGYTNIRIRATALVSGTVNVTMLPAAFASENAPAVQLQTGANTIGAVAIAAAQTLATVTTVTTVTTVSTLTNITNWGNVADNAAFTDGTTRLSMGGYIFDEAAGTALTENDAAAARVDSKRAQVQVIEDATTRGQRQAVNTSGGASVTIAPHTSGGYSVAKVQSAASTNQTNVKASAGQVYGWALFNNTAVIKYLKFHNTAGSPTAGASVVQTVMLPASSGTNIEFLGGIPFATGIAYTIVTGGAESNTTAVGADEVMGVILYK